MENGKKDHLESFGVKVLINESASAFPTSLVDDMVCNL